MLATKHLLGWKTIGYVEIDDYCQKLIAQRIKDGYLDNAPIFTDIRAFIGSGCCELYKGVTDVITAGFPCQPFSVAGKQKGETDERNMWPATIKCIRTIRPQYIFLENVPGLLDSGYMPQIFSDLVETGYNARWCVLGASDCGAPHIRKRIWILAYTNSKRNTRERQAQGNKVRPFIGRSFTPAAWGDMSIWEKWLHRPELLRVPYGFPNIMERIKAIGNGQVPTVVKTAWEILKNFPEPVRVNERV